MCCARGARQRVLPRAAHRYAGMPQPAARVFVVPLRTLKKLD